MRLFIGALHHFRAIFIDLSTKGNRWHFQIDGNEIMAASFVIDMLSGGDSTGDNGGVCTFFFKQ